MWDAIAGFFKNPDSWTWIFGLFGTFTAAGLTYLVKKLDWRFVLSLKPRQPSIGPSEITKLIDEKLKETVQFKDYETLKADHFQTLALFKVSESQWEEKIMELRTEIAQLRAESQRKQQKETTSERQE